jgi:hypothetical protein
MSKEKRELQNEIYEKVMDIFSKFEKNEISIDGSRGEIDTVCIGELIIQRGIQGTFRVNIGGGFKFTTSKNSGIWDIIGDYTPEDILNKINIFLSK